MPAASATAKPATRHASRGWLQALVPSALRSPAVSVLLFVALAALAYALLTHRSPGHPHAWLQHAAHLTHQQQQLAPGVSELYEVRLSTVPGAGLGVFARRDLPAGTLWNREDAQPSAHLQLNRQQWTALLGLAEHLKAAGQASHPLVQAVVFMDIYGYHCSANSFVVSLTGSTFVNHAPQTLPDQQHLHHQPRRSGPGRHLPSTRAQAAGSTPAAATSTHSTAPAALQRTANSDGLPDGAPWVQRLTAIEQCTVSITLRNIKAGEEILEDYRRYCDDGEVCEEPAFIDTKPFIQGTQQASTRTAASAPQQQQQQQRSGRRSALAATGSSNSKAQQHKLVQLPGLQLRNSSVSGGGLGLFAAADLPAGTVWNKADAQTSLVITRAQWDKLMQLQRALVAVNATRPIVDNFVHALRALSYCCPTSGAMHVPLTASVFAARASPGVPANSLLVAGQPGSSRDDAAACTGSRLRQPLRKGQEVVDDRRSFRCTWPGV